MAFAPGDWKIGISQPVTIALGDPGMVTVVDLASTEYRAMATSGSAERGEHIWNPKAGKAPANELLQVSVVARDLVTADVWATAAFAEGPDCLKHLERIDGVEAIIVLPDGGIDGTSGFAKLLAR